MMGLLRGIKEVCGCLFKGDKKYEIMMNHIKGKERLIDGFKIKNCQIMARCLNNYELVSFMNLSISRMRKSNNSSKEEEMARNRHCR